MRTVIFSALLLVLTNAAALVAQRGEPMTVWMEGGREVRAVILAVEDSVIYADFSGQKWDAVTTASNILVSVLPLDSVAFVVKEGKPWNGNGMLIGMLVGTGLGALVGWTGYQEPEPGSRALIQNGQEVSTLLLALICGPLGGAVGAIVDLASIVPKKIIDPSTKDGYQQLLECAVYRNTLPAALRSNLNRTVAVSH